MLRSVKLVGFFIIVLLVHIPSLGMASSEAAIREAAYGVDVEAMAEWRSHWEQASASAEKYSTLAAVFNFYADYYEFVTDDSGLRREYTDKTIEAAERALDLGAETASVYALLADGYARRITGAITGIRFGSRLSNAVEQAEALDPDNEDLLYLQGKQYLLAPTLAGGDRDKAVERFEWLTQEYPGSYFYRVLLAKALLNRDPERAAALLEEAEALRR